MPDDPRPGKRLAASVVDNQILYACRTQNGLAIRYSKFLAHVIIPWATLSNHLVFRQAV